MCKQLIYGTCVAVILSVSTMVQAGTFTDSFDAAHDYLTQGVEGTGWDGFVGRGAGEAVSALNASTDRAGALYMASTGAYWSDPWSPLGPFLYKVVQGDFVATVRVSDYATGVYYNNCGLMARVANAADAGAGEDWISIDYFPLYGVGNIVRYAENNARSEDVGGNGTGTNAHRYLQLERVGNTFYLRTSTDGVTWVNYPDASFTGLNRPDLDGLAVQVGIHQATFSSALGYVVFEDFSVSGDMVSVGNKAIKPKPASKATDVMRDIVVSWTPAEGAAKHNVYFGTDPAGISLASQGQDANTYDPGLLVFGQTYYWRVDEVQADGVTIDQGDVWNFTVEPPGYPIKNVTATASSAHSKDMGPEKTVDGSGLSPDDKHNVDGKAMWLSNRKGPEPTWIRFQFDKSYKLYEMWVWNSNQAMESSLGVGAKDVTIEYSTDAATWTTLGDFEFAQAPSEDDYASNTTVNLRGAVAKYVKLTIKSNWFGALPQYGLSEVRFFYVPVSAREPKPATDTTGLHPQVTLSWRAGREATSHEVYLGSDPNNLPLATTVPEPTYDAALNLGQKYFWKVVEVNATQGATAWPSEVWNFSTAESIAVDDFESYTNESPKRVFQTWIDGAGFSKDDYFPNGHSGNGTGSLIGYDPEAGNIMETSLIHGGRQSMPLYYDNSAGGTSEAERTFGTPQDWSKHGITTLVIWFRGDPNNVAAPLYAKINGTKVLYNGGAASTAFPLWKQWNITLSSVAGLNLTSIKTLTIGVGNGPAGATGTIFIDDIALYATAPQVATATDPGTNGLVLLYAMEGNVQDTSGKGNHGTTSGDPGYLPSMAGMGKALQFDGLNDHVNVPVGTLLSTLTNATFTAWVNFSGAGGSWQRVFDFGTGDTNYMFLTPNTGAGAARFAIRTAAVGEQRATNPSALGTGWHHLAIVIDATSMALRLYQDGTLVRTSTTTLLPKDLGVTTQNWLGRSQFTGDPFFNGLLDDFRIYNRVLTAPEVRYLAGDR